MDKTVKAEDRSPHEIEDFVGWSEVAGGDSRSGQGGSCPSPRDSAWGTKIR